MLPSEPEGSRIFRVTSRPPASSFAAARPRRGRVERCRGGRAAREQCRRDCERGGALQETASAQIGGARVFRVGHGGSLLGSSRSGSELGSHRFDLEIVLCSQRSKRRAVAVTQPQPATCARRPADASDAQMCVGEARNLRNALRRDNEPMLLLFIDSFIQPAYARREFE